MSDEKVETGEVENTEDESTSEPIEVDWGKVEIPRDVIKNTPEYQELLSESISRRKKISAIEAQLKELEEVSQESDETPKSQEANVVESDLVDQIMQQLAPKFEQLDSLSQEIKSRSEQTEFTRLSVEYNLSNEDRELMKEFPQDRWESFAKRVGKKAVDDTLDGQGKGTKENSVIKTLKSRMNMHVDTDNIESQSPFSPEFQRSKGGGFDEL